MPNTSRKGNRGNQGSGAANRRDDDERGQRTQGRGDRAQQGIGRQDSGRNGSRSGSGAGAGRNKKSSDR